MSSLHFPTSSWKGQLKFREDQHRRYLGYFQSCFREQFRREGVGKTAKISILRKEKGNRDSGTNFQDIFLRLKIGLTLGLSWEKPRQMKSSYINCLSSITWLVGIELKTRLRDSDWLASSASFFPLLYRSHLKAIKVTIISNRSTQSQGKFKFMAPSSLHFPHLKAEKGGEKKKAAPFKVGTLSLFIWQPAMDVSTGVALETPRLVEPGLASALLELKIRRRACVFSHSVGSDSLQHHGV